MALPKYDPNRVPDREIKAKPGTEVCDFCTDPKPLFGFPCRPHVSGVVPVALDGGPGETVAQSPDDWAACQQCHDLIVKADREALVLRSVDHLPRAQRRALTRKVAYDAIRQVQDQFWANRNGDPYPISERFNFIAYAVPKDRDDDMTDGQGIACRTFGGTDRIEVELEAEDWVDRNTSPDNPDFYRIEEDT